MKRFVAIVMVLCCYASTFAQGMYWQSTSEGMGGKHVTDNYAVPKMFKVVRTGETGEGSVMIFRLDKELIWMLNPDEKTYSEMTFADMEKMANKGAEQMAAMKEQMKNMPEEQRKAMEKMMGGGDQEVTVKNTGETKTVNGRKCKKYIVFRGEEEFMTLWVSDEVKEFESLMGDWKSFSERMASLTARFAKGMSDVYKKINGFPMETKISMMGQTVTTTVTKIEKRSTPSSEFEVPSGYKKVKSAMEKGMHRQGKEE
jgi:hypothetical protein